MVIVLVAEGRHDKEPGVLHLEFGPIDVQAMDRLFAMAYEVGRRFTEIGHEFGDIAALEDVGAGGLAIADTLNPVIGSVLNARIPVIVGWKEHIPRDTFYSVILEEDIEAFRKVRRFLAAEGIVVFHNHDRLPFRMFFHKLQTFDVTHSAAEGSVRILNGLYTVDFLGRDAHTLKLGLQMCASVRTMFQIDVENGVYVFHFGNALKE